jgi:ADP-heptose:LPS heptosyltransferase
VFGHLQIYEPRERLLVGLADVALSPVGWMRRRPAPAAALRRILLLRLERIGDLLMVLDAIRDARAAWPEAEIDLAVGSWNVPIARLIPEIDRIEIADVAWLAREAGGDRWPALVGRARQWRDRRYDLVINFEPDIRSNFLAWLTGAPRRLGYWTAGGGAWLTDALEYAPSAHVADNARQLVAHASGRSGPSGAASPTVAGPRLVVPPDALARADALLAGLHRPIVGIHASGGRPSKQWHLGRFASVAQILARDRGASIVLTGADADAPVIDEVRRAMAPVPALETRGLDLVTLAALLSRLDLLVSGDTGPMHLAAAMDTPLVGIFGPSNPARYGPQSSRQRVVRIDLWCSPCGRVRLPPERCRGHVPDCLDGISVGAVADAATELLDQVEAGASAPAPPIQPGLKPRSPIAGSV